jgi:hypothetical protein
MARPILPTANLRQQMRFAPLIRAEVAMEQVCSLPIPGVENGRIVGDVFYYSRHFFPATATANLYPPTGLARFSWETGEPDWFRKTEPDHLGFGPSRFTVIGHIDHRAVDNQARSDGLGGAVERSEALNGLYDALVPLWADGGAVDSAKAARFCTLFPTVSPPLYQPAYRRLSTFFQWVGLP